MQFSHNTPYFSRPNINILTALNRCLTLFSEGNGNRLAVLPQRKNEYFY